MPIFPADPGRCGRSARAGRGRPRSERGAMRAGDRAIFDELHRRGGIADAHPAFGRPDDTGSSRAARRAGAGRAARGAGATAGARWAAGLDAGWPPAPRRPRKRGQEGDLHLKPPIAVRSRASRLGQSVVSSSSPLMVKDGVPGHILILRGRVAGQLDELVDRGRVGQAFRSSAPPAMPCGRPKLEPGEPCGADDCSSGRQGRSRRCHPASGSGPAPSTRLVLIQRARRREEASAGRRSAQSD